VVWYADDVIPSPLVKVAEAGVHANADEVEKMFVEGLWSLPDAVARHSEARSLGVVQDIFLGSGQLHEVIPPHEHGFSHNFIICSALE